MDIVVHHSISDLYKTLGLPFDNEIDFSILSVPEIHQEIPFTSPALRADYFSFILTIDGSGVYYLDEHTFPFGSGTIYFTNPGHTKSYELHRSKEAYIIMVAESFLWEFVHAEVYDEFPFLLAEIVPPQTLPEQLLKDLVSLYTQIEFEFEQPSRYKNQILGNLLANLLLKIKEQFWMDYNPISEGDRNSEIVKSFKQILEKEFKEMVSDKTTSGRLQVKDFAEQLNLHPNYLNSVIRSKTGRTIHDWLNRKTLTTAKYLLRNTSLTSKSISYRLGFSEPTHFTRFFKKHLHTTPSKFRNNPSSKK